MSIASGDVWAQLRSGDTVLGLARASGATGHKARELAVNDAIGMAQRLAELGWDVRAHLPAREVLLQALADAPAQRSVRADGRPFYNTFVEVDLRAACGLFLLVSCGSGMELDDNCAQPFAARAAELVGRIAPRLTFGKRFDRWVRRAWALGPLMLQLEQQREAFVGDGRHGIMPMSALSSLMVFFTTNSGQQEADKLPELTRNGMVLRTDTQMVEGRCRLGVPHVPPPGLATARLHDAMRAGDVALFLDTPGCRPAPSEVAYGLPRVTDEAGVAVDQVANVRFFLARYGRPDWPTSRLVRALAARRFSTEGIRRQRGADAFLPLAAADNKDSARYLRSLIANLEVYRTGRWVCALGVPGFGDIVIDNVMPPDGQPWASPQRFAEIETFRGQRRASLVHGRAEMTFSGLRAEVNGEAAVLLSGTKHSGVNHGEPVYRMANAEDYPSSQRAVRTRVRLPHRVLAEAILAGLQDATDAPLQRLLPEEGDADLEVLHVRHTTLGHDIQRLHRTQQVIYQRLTSTDADGDLATTGALYRDLQQQYNDLAEQLTQQRAELDTLTAEIDRFRKARNLQGGPPEQLLLMLSTLRDAYHTKHRQLWHEVIDTLTITVSPLQIAGHDGTTIDIRGRLRINDGSDTYTIALQHSFRAGVATQAQTRIDALTADLRQGIPVQDSTVPRARLLAKDVAKSLHRSPLSFSIAQITDPGILRLAMAVLHPADRQTSDLQHLADVHDEPLVLLQRIAAIHDPVTRRRAAWKMRPSPKLACVYLSAAHNAGKVLYDHIIPDVYPTSRSVQAMIYSKSCGGEFTTIYGHGYQLTPCQNCGSHRRSILVIPEPDRSVCLDCRQDRSGVTWPTQPYERYQTHPHADDPNPDRITAALTDPNQQPRTDAILTTLQAANRPLNIDQLLSRLQQQGRTCDDRQLLRDTLSHLKRLNRVTQTQNQWATPQS